MSVDFNKLAAANKAAVDSMLSVANTALAAAERIGALNLSVARSSLEDSAAAMKTVMNAKDPQAAAAAQQALVQPAVDKAVAYSRSLYEIAAETQEEVAKLFEAQIAEFQKATSALMNEASKSAPAGADAMVKSVQEAYANLAAAFGPMTALNKQFADAAKASVTGSANKATAAAAKKARNK